MENKGMICLVGTGLGDPALMTLKGQALLSSCGALAYDHLASRQFSEWVPSAYCKIYVGKQVGHHSMKQDRINAALVKLALLGLTIIRLKGEDPFVFERDGEETQALGTHRTPYETVPGAASAIAAPECTRTPIIHHGASRSLHVITGHTRDGGDCLPPEFEIYDSLSDTLVSLMGLGQLLVITARLVEGGTAPDAPATVIENDTLPDQRAIQAPLSGIHAKVMEAGIGTPAIIVMDEIASFDMKCDLKCRSFGPLTRYRIGMAGIRHFTGSSGHTLKQEETVVSPILEMKTMSHIKCPAMQEVYRNLAAYTRPIFTSANGMRLFFQEVQHSGMDYRLLGHIKSTVIGDGTGRKLTGFGFHADYMPDSFCAEVLTRGPASTPADSNRILVAHSKGGSPVLASILGRAGLVYDGIALYQVENRLASEQKQAEEGFNHITFVSAFGVRAHLSSDLNINPGQRTGQIRLVCIGNITVGELKKHGIKADITAGTYHVQGLAQAIADDAISRKVEGPISV